MNKQKQTYLSPETETLVIRFEGVVCTSPLNGVNAVFFTEYLTGGVAGDDGYEELTN